MVWLIFTVILVIIGTGCVFGLFFATTDDGKSVAGLGIAGAVVGVVLAFFIASIKIVDAGHVGVVKSFSKYSTVVPAGWHFMAPWKDVSEQNVRIVKETFDMTGGNSAVSKESQSIGIVMKVNYRVSSDKKSLLNLYNNVGSGWKDTLVEGRVPQDTKAITARYPTAAITANREEIREQVRKALAHELNQYAINIEDVQLANITFPLAFEKAIEAKQVQTQKALQAEAKVAQSRAEAQQKVATAQGAAESTILRARADATANKLLANSLTDRVIQQHTIDALGNKVQVIVTDGKSPVVLGGSNPGSVADDTTGASSGK